MADEWRVSLIFESRPVARKSSYFYRTVVCGLLRSRLGDDIAVSAETTQIFLYARTAEAAAEAEHMAQEVLAQQNLSAEFRFERWDPSGEAWRDARSRDGAPGRASAEPPAAPDDKSRQGRLCSAAGVLVDSVVQAVVDGMVP